MILMCDIYVKKKIITVRNYFMSDITTLFKMKKDHPNNFFADDLDQITIILNPNY